MKSEPETYSLLDLKRDGVAPWDGVRNYQARNFMRDQMRKGDPVLFYHSNSLPSGVVGLAEVCREGYPDFTAWDSRSEYFDPRSVKDSPTWYMVDLKFVKIFPLMVSLEKIKKNPRLKEMMVSKKGMRLSVQPVSSEHFHVIVNLGRARQSRRLE